MLSLPIDGQVGQVSQWQPAFKLACSLLHKHGLGSTHYTLGLLPPISDTRNSTKKTINNILAIQAAVPANAQNPKAPAIRATNRNNIA